MNGILYRALAARLDTTDPEVWVFFECPPLLHPGTELARLLAAVWWTSAENIEICNVNSESSLFSDWCWSESTSTGDARLFECGIGDGGVVHYVPRERVLFLVTGATLQRLAIAQRDADTLWTSGYSVDIGARRVAAPATATATPYRAAA